MARRIVNAAYALDHRQVSYHNKVVTTTGGTIGSQTDARRAGIQVAKVAAEVGRYRITVPSSGSTLLNVHGTIKGADDAAFTDATGYALRVRRDNITTDATFDVQFVDKASADAEVEDAASVYFTVVLSER